MGVVRKKKEEYIGLHESIWCMGGGEWGEGAGEGGEGGGGGGAGGVTVLRMMSKQQNCHSNVCRSVDCYAYIFHRFFFFFFFQLRFLHNGRKAGHL